MHPGSNPAPFCIQHCCRLFLAAPSISFNYSHHNRHHRTGLSAARVVLIAGPSVTTCKAALSSPSGTDRPRHNPHSCLISRACWHAPSHTYFWLETVVISGKESSSSTCSWSSTTYTPVQFTAMITSFLGRFGPAGDQCHLSSLAPSSKEQK